MHATRDLATLYHRPGKIAPYPAEAQLIRWHGKTFWVCEANEESVEGWLDGDAKADYVIALAVVRRE